MLTLSGLCYCASDAVAMVNVT